ncbi:SLAP domain-containing protein [Lactobacillus kefiranofaciens subsp. kefirgranum]|uniref:SLAP domain-containing protein n=1 Tax=Lactobacillus kefiranofaciens TaxID=267818 RepID=UPI0006D01028|nr:SLAP domain-containing protein [Lactobacillus kefiranofaciens]
MDIKVFELCIHKLKATNIDGVTRKITHNAYIYRTSTGRTSYNGRWKLYKGQTVTTYGGSYKFKNGKHYFRVGGPQKQYIKSYNLGPVVKVNTVQGRTSNNDNTNITANSKPTSSTPTSTEETTITVDANYSTPIITFDKNGKVVKVRTATPGEKFTVDRLEKGTRADKVASYIGQFGGDQSIYRIKGTNNWLYSMGVKAASKITAHDYDLEETSIIKFTQTTDLYNANGTFQNIKIEKNSEQWRVNKLLYIWVPSENKAELFYHLAPTSYWKDVLRLSNNGQYVHDHIPLKDTYVKASDVQFVESSVKLTPENTITEAQTATQKN